MGRSLAIRKGAAGLMGSTFSVDAESEFMDSKSNHWRIRIALVLCAAVVIPVGVAVVHTYPPAQYHIYPPCIFFSLTGLHCAGCGATRCVGALLHGDIVQAFAYNPLFVILLPYLIFSVGGQIIQAWSGMQIRYLQMPRWLALLIVVAVIGFSIARNFTVYPLVLLAPHEVERTIDELEPGEKANVQGK
jgi:hypothetical protein